jgi:hypothetical protein
VVSAGTATNYTQIDLSGYVIPANAKSVFGYIDSYDTDASSAAAFLSSTAAGLGEMIAAISLTGVTSTNFFVPFSNILIIESQKLYYKVNAGSSVTIMLSGWEY